MGKLLGNAAKILAALIAVQHLGFLVLQIFLWQCEAGMSVFGTTPETAAITAQLAMQQGLYNGILAAGLIFGLMRPGKGFLTFFLIAVLAAGVFGALTVSPTIFFVQGLPALLTLLLMLLSRNTARTI